ncbi:ATP-binding cassette domain-containing protein, partial [Salmonella enterica subsp. enterica serovar Typhimurium]
GESVAVVGASGSGKSTLLMLLARFYDPCSGKIWLNTSEGRQNLRDIRLEALRRRVGIVFEDAFLFAGTVAENIAYGHPQATADDIRRAAAAAGASAFINPLPTAFDSLFTERATNLSGGPMPRILPVPALITAPACVHPV